MFSSSCARIRRQLNICISVPDLGLWSSGVIKACRCSGWLRTATNHVATTKSDMVSPSPRRPSNPEPYRFAKQARGGLKAHAFRMNKMPATQVTSHGIASFYTEPRPRQRKFHPPRN
jgi:hypothetical protein